MIKRLLIVLGIGLGVVFVPYGIGWAVIYLLGSPALHESVQPAVWVLGLSTIGLTMLIVSLFSWIITGR